MRNFAASVILLFCCTYGCRDEHGVSSPYSARLQSGPKYIFLMIGDGMGQVQRKTYTQYLRATAQDGSVEARSVYGVYDSLLTACESVRASLAGVKWTTFTHSGAMVLTTAVGVGAERFAGRYDNTQIKTKILQTMSPAPIETTAAK